MKKKPIVKYTADELKKLRKKGDTGTDWNRVLGMSQAEADRLAESDTPSLKHKKKPVSKPVSLALDPEVTRFYKHYGKQWQRQINAVLKAYMLVQEHRV
ncbi:MAG: BrnA antitoxin family protein [Alphaproteobacteria bacterium]|nr:BrnA antitoxin family protein [Alphaproteobacteria bacterium]